MAPRSSPQRRTAAVPPAPTSGTSAGHRAERTDMRPPGPAGTRTNADARRILLTRGLRGFADGLVSVLLAGYLTRLGFTPFQVGAVVTGTLLGSAAPPPAARLAGAGGGGRRVLFFSPPPLAVAGIGLPRVGAVLAP